jgi:hypothetical protein
MALPARQREKSRKTLPSGDPKIGLTAMSLSPHYATGRRLGEASNANQN